MDIPASPTAAATAPASARRNNNNNNLGGPELRGANITIDTILRPTNVLTRQTKIVCTLGPACWAVPQLESLIDAGLAVARFNFSHGDHEGHAACLERLRQAADNKKQHVGASVCVLVLYHDMFVSFFCVICVMCPY